jgi:hypothetical protein
VLLYTVITNTPLLHASSQLRWLCESSRKASIVEQRFVDHTIMWRRLTSRHVKNGFHARCADASEALVLRERAKKPRTCQ